MTRPSLKELGLKPLCPTVIGSSAFPGWYSDFQDRVAAHPEGYGAADKPQMQGIVRAILNLAEIPKPDDAADALAVAICHLHSARLNSLTQQGGPA